MEKFSAILLSAIFVCSLCGWVYFLIGAFKVVVNKDGTNKQTCKTIKVHKKLEGTEVPVKK